MNYMKNLFILLHLDRLFCVFNSRATHGQTEPYSYNVRKLILVIYPCRKLFVVT